MAEPTLKDVLDALTRLEKGQAQLEKGYAQLEKGQAQLEKGQAQLERGQREIRAEMATKAETATKADLEKFRADVNERFDRVDEQLAEIDRDLDGHMKVHAELEKDVEALKGRPLRTAARARRGAKRRASK